MMLNMDFVIRLLVAGILGTIIGLDREYRAKEAGYRTHFLVSLGSSSPTRVNTVAAIPMVYIPAPTAKPIPAVAQIPAAVVNPRTICF